MKLYLFSGSGIGAGKSTTAKRLTQEVWSLASGMREDLTRRYPTYNWYNKSQEYKDTTIIEEYGDGRRTMRDVLIEYGQSRCKNDPAYWAKELVTYLKRRRDMYDGITVFGVDDLRKMCELETIKEAFPGIVVHFHIDTARAKAEAEFENDQLAKVADYVLRWEK